MGAGHLMSVSLEKPANALVRLHMAVNTAVSKIGNADTLPINDGVFIIAPTKEAIQLIVRQVMIDLACIFISTPDPQNRVMLRGAIAYGPVYRGKMIAKGLGQKKQQQHLETLERVAFGPAVIQAYSSESAAPPYGLAVHESARSFAPPGTKPFLMTHWLWWLTHKELEQPKGAPPLAVLKDVLCTEIHDYLQWMRATLIMHGLKVEKLSDWESQIRQYFRLKSGDR